MHIRNHSGGVGYGREVDLAMVSVDGPSVGVDAIPSPVLSLDLNVGTGAGTRLIGVAGSWVAPECTQNKRLEGAERPSPSRAPLDVARHGRRRSANS